MTNPWLNIPLQDYEGHMALPEVGQAEMLTNQLEGLLARHQPSSVALVGCGGGNGFVQVAEAGVKGLVGIDINPQYVADAQARFGDKIVGLETLCADIEQPLSGIEPVALIYAALVFEYVDIAKAMLSLRELCVSGGSLATLLQLPKEGAASVSPSLFTSLQDLRSIMRLVPPSQLRAAAEHVGFTLLSEETISLASGKQFCLQVFSLPK